MKKLPSSMRQLLNNDRAEMSDMIRGIILLVVAALLVGSLLPSVLNTNARTTSGASSWIGGVNVSTGGDGTSKAGNWSTSMLSTWDAVPIMIVLSALLVFVFLLLRFVKG